jgi:hypothetical protein
MMKLYVEQLPGSGEGGRSFVIYNEAGETLPCIVEAHIHHAHDDAARIGLHLVVDGTNIVFGSPPSVPRPDASESSK